MDTAVLPRLAVFKFSSCDGCQLSLLNLEGDLLAIAEKVEIAYFAEASSVMAEGPYDIALVEGSITTPREAELIKTVRRNSKLLVTIGACASSGGIQALRNWQDVANFAHMVYATPKYIDSLAECTPIAAHVAVDYSIQGCPVQKEQLLEVLTSLLMGFSPKLPAHSVCVECKRRGNVCVLVAKGELCLGPLTHAGCGGLCPAFNRGCFGCFGPMESANTDALVAQLQGMERQKGDVQRMLRTFNAYAEEFRSASDKLERGTA